MIRKTFLQVPQMEDPSQRKKLFITKIKYQGKVYNFLINSNSTNNMVSKEMVQNQNLNKIPHPYSYHVSWLTKDQQTLVTEKALVELSLGDFKDKVMCDIMEMDTCHLLLGRPQQYDVDATHNCRKNTNTIVKDGITYTMKPLPNPRLNKEPTIIVLGEKEIVRTLKESNDEGYALVVKPKDPINYEPIPNEFKDNLNKYSEITKKELPFALPPLGTITHQIDFIPGASFPNKAPYKMTLDQNDEISIQVQVMLEKGLIQKSLSPCVVPSVLAPKNDGKWRLCTDSRAINKIKIRYRFPIPRIEDLLDQLGNDFYFPKIHLKLGYHQIRIRPRNEWKIGFKTT